MAYQDAQSMPKDMRHAVFSIYDMVPPDSDERGDVASVRTRVRDFLASFDTLKMSG
ncbi:MAG: hypothetical protein K0U50_09000 [Alphaproteobacteria bacterium]|nr:hypothetical protein [Alphaproteobacteria bacterium]